MPAKKDNPRNRTAAVALSDLELAALRSEAANRKISMSDLIYEKLRKGNLRKTVASFVANSVPHSVQKDTENGTGGDE